MSQWLKDLNPLQLLQDEVGNKKAAPKHDVI